MIIYVHLFSRHNSFPEELEKDRVGTAPSHAGHDPNQSTAQKRFTRIGGPFCERDKQRLCYPVLTAGTDELPTPKENSTWRNHSPKRGSTSLQGGTGLFNRRSSRVVKVNPGSRQVFPPPFGLLSCPTSTGFSVNK